MSAKHTKHNLEAEWAREKQITAQFGLSHTILYNLRKSGKIRTVSLRGKGKEYGARIYNIESVRQFIASQESMEKEVNS